MRLRIVFFGSSKYSVVVAKKLHEKLGLVLIVTTQKDSPPQKFAIENNIESKVFEKLDENAISQIKSYKPDFIVVADYGKILPKELLSLPRFDCLNVHHSLLPKYRGPSPAPTAILRGEKITGVSIISMQEEVDAGPIFAQKEYKLKDTDTTDSLLMELNYLGGELVCQVINNTKGQQESHAQDNSKVTYTKLLNKNDGFIDTENPPPTAEIDKMIRAYFPWPGVFLRYNFDGKWKILKLLPEKKIQVEGKKPMSYKDFINGYKEGRRILSKLKLI